MSEEQLQKLKDYCLRLLSLRPRSIQEIRMRLEHYASKKKIPPELVPQVIDSFIEINLVNDEDFAKWWVEQRQSHKPKGKRAIESELKNKGIDKQIISNVLSPANDDIVDESLLAQKVLEKKLPLYTHLSQKELKIKLSTLLAQRGFEWDTIYKVIDSFMKKEYNKRQ